MHQEVQIDEEASAEARPIEIFVRTIATPCLAAQTVTLHANVTETISALKEKISEKAHIPVAAFRLEYDGMCSF